MSGERLVRRRAIEALRSGVPNADAVRVLGSDQHEAEGRFRRQLEAVGRPDSPSKGMLVAGDFGTGKSHLLKYLEQLALSAGFVTSLVVISKETPLYDRAKMYRSAVGNAQVPGRTGQVIHEIGLGLHQDTREYAAFYSWANSPESGMAALFPATLLLHERLNNDPEFVEQIRNFWAGDPIPIARVREGLRQIRESAAFSLKAVRLRDLAEMRFPFAARLIRAAGFRGWVVLIDEIELIGRYSLLQRARSYAELAWWMGEVESSQPIGVGAVGAVTADYDAFVLDQKGDWDYVGARLRDRGTDDHLALAARAEAGMRLLRRSALHLERPTVETLARTHSRLRAIHGVAFGWDPPELASPELGIQTSMRSHVRRWINEWDLMRLYPGSHVEIEESALGPSYAEDLVLEEEPGDGQPEMQETP